MPIRLYLYLGAGLAVLLAGWALHHRIDAGGYDRCVHEQQVAAAQTEKEDTARYLAAVDWGNQVSAQLAVRQTEIQTLRSQHAQYALTLDGTCPGRLRLIHDAAALGTTVPDTPIASLAETQPLDADRIASTVAENYARARDCQAQLNALIDWFQGAKRDHE